MKTVFVFLITASITISCGQNEADKSQNQDQNQSEEEVQADIQASTKIRKGQKVPEFDFRTTENQRYSINELRGKVVLLTFFATWCPTCQKEMPALQNRVWDQYGDNQDFFMVGIGREQDMNKMKEFKEKNGYDFHFAPDTGRVIYNKFAGKYIPRNVVVDSRGTSVYQGTGYDEKTIINILKLLEKELNN